MKHSSGGVEKACKLQPITPTNHENPSNHNADALCSLGWPSGRSLIWLEISDVVTSFRDAIKSVKTTSLLRSVGAFSRTSVCCTESKWLILPLSSCHSVVFSLRWNYDRVILGIKCMWWLWNICRKSQFWNCNRFETLRLDGEESTRDVWVLWQNMQEILVNTAD